MPYVYVEPSKCQHDAWNFVMSWCDRCGVTAEQMRTRFVHRVNEPQGPSYIVTDKPGPLGPLIVDRYAAMVEVLDRFMPSASKQWKAVWADELLMGGRN